MKLYVGNLPWSIDDKGLGELFASYGDVEEAVLIKDRFSGRSKGFGFVTIADDAAAQKAIAEMHEKQIEGRPLTVSEAKPMVSRDDAPRDSGSDSAPEAEETVADVGADDIGTAEEAKDDAESDEPAAENAPEAEESTESEESTDSEESTESEKPAESEESK